MLDFRKNISVFLIVLTDKSMRETLFENLIGYCDKMKCFGCILETYSAYFAKIFYQLNNVFLTMFFNVYFVSNSAFIVCK